MPSPGRLSRTLAAQLARPHGWTGRLLGGAMDMANRRATQTAIDLLGPQVGERVLDAGCGTGAALDRIRRRAACALFGVDPSPAMLAAARRKLGERAFLADGALGSLPFPDASFDAALALNVLYFCDHEGAMLRDLYRVLRPGGRLVAYVTDRETMQRWSFASAGHHRLFDATELKVALVNAGFAFPAVMIHHVRVGPGVRGLFAQASKQG